jgi:glycerophosphoryl diester phosphodiesterase
MGADFIEPDLVITKDGVLIARHENELGSTTDVASRFPDRRRSAKIDGQNVTGWFAEDFTLAEVRTLRAKERMLLRTRKFDGQFGIPTFDEVIELAQRMGRERGRPVGVYPETKHPSYFKSIGLPLEPAVVASLDRAGWNRAEAPVFIQSFETENLRALAKSTRVRLIQLVTRPEQVDEAGLQSIAGYAAGVGAEKKLVQPIAATGALAPPTDLVRRGHAKQLIVHVWTLRSDPEFLPAAYKHDASAEFRRFKELGVDGVFTDFPDVGVRVYGKR